MRRFRKSTEYDAEKANKKNNYSHINGKYCAKGQVVLAGDSITELFNMELFDDYTEKSGLRVYSRGISGDTSDRLIERFEENVLSLEPSVLVLLIGTNDLTRGADPKYICDNVRTLIDFTQKYDGATKIILQSVYPVEYKNKSKNLKICELNNLLEALAGEKGIEYIDIHSLLCDEKGGFSEKYTYDGLHPNVAGFEIVASEIFKVL